MVCNRSFSFLVLSRKKKNMKKVHHNSNGAGNKLLFQKFAMNNEDPKLRNEPNIPTINEKVPYSTPLLMSLNLKILPYDLLSHNSTNVESDLKVNSNVFVTISSFVSIVCWCFVLVHTLHILTCLPVYGLLYGRISIAMCECTLEYGHIRACVLRLCMRFV